MSDLVPIERIQHAILLLRDQKVLIDTDLAELYGVETRALVQAVRRNAERFPEDFMFQLNGEEWEALRALRSQTVISKPGGRGGRRYAPYAFTEQGVAMLSSVLRSPRAIEVNIAIMRAFVQLRRFIASHEALAERLVELEVKMDSKFEVVFEVLEKLVNEDVPTSRRIGFRVDDGDGP